MESANLDPITKAISLPPNPTPAQVAKTFDIGEMLDLLEIARETQVDGENPDVKTLIEAIALKTATDEASKAIFEEIKTVMDELQP